MKKQFGTLAVLFTVFPVLGIELVEAGTAELVKNLERFDHVNRDQKLDRDELSNLAKHQLNATFRAYDKNADGVIDIKELEAGAQINPVLLRAQQAEFEYVLDGRDAIPLPEAVREWAVKQTQPTMDLPIKLRRTFKEVTIFKGAKKSLDDEPASFSYVHDFSNSNDIFSAQGALIYPFDTRNIEEGASSDNFILQTIAGAFGIEFDHVTNEQNPAAESDSLSFHGNLQLEFGGGGIFEKQYISIEGVAVTDFHADTAILGADVDWLPVIAPLAVNSINYLSENIGYRVRAIARARFGTVLDNGGSAGLQQGEFVRIGGDLGFEFYLSDFYAVGRWLRAGVRWQLLESLSGETGYSDLLEASVDYYPAGNEHFSLSAVYRNGDIPFVKKEVEQLTVGLGVKF